MTIAVILKFLSAAGKRSLEFLRKYWMQIIGIALCIGMIWAGYLWGFNVADNKWIIANNKQVGDLNAKIGRLEKQASADSLKAQEEQKKLQERLDDLLKGVPTIVAHDSQGNELRCGPNNVPVPVYLGPEFSNAWNKINAESNK